MTQTGAQAAPGLDGVRALVTGGTSGLGFAMSQALGDAGARVVLTGRFADRAEAAAARTGHGGRVASAASDGVTGQRFVATEFRARPDGQT